MAKETKTNSDIRITAYFVIDRETKGALRFQEVNSEGQQVDITEASIGTLYLRKSALEKAGIKGPRGLKIVIESIV
jgi:hypothetical protein